MVFSVKNRKKNLFLGVSTVIALALSSVYAPVVFSRVVPARYSEPEEVGTPKNQDLVLALNSKEEVPIIVEENTASMNYDEMGLWNLGVTSSDQASFNRNYNKSFTVPGSVVVAEEEHNDSIATANQLVGTANLFAYGEINSSSDVDFFSFFNETNNYAIVLVLPDNDDYNNTQIPPSFALYNASGERVEYSLETGIPGVGRYYVAISSSGTGSESRYRLVIRGIGTRGSAVSSSQ